jgi:Emfourin
MAEPWQISLERSGGFAGIPVNAEADSAKLQPAEAAELDLLASAVDFGGTAAVPEPRPDSFQYHLVARHGTEQHELRLGESQLDPALKALVGWLIQHSRS